MELQTIVERYAEAFTEVDRTIMTAGVNRRTKMAYQLGIQPMTEAMLMAEADQAWANLHPGELSDREVEMKYLEPAGTSAAVDHVFTATQDPASNEPEWGIELKRLQFVGDNGKPNDFAVGKVLSPYLKDRGMLHDALRLRQYGFTRRIAVVGYAFNYDDAYLAEVGNHHPPGDATAHQIKLMIKRNGPLQAGSLIEFADAILRLRGFTQGPRAEARFEAWRHPGGGFGTVFGWEIRRAEREEGFDPRHPW